jgi:hypothetical protein
VHYSLCDIAFDITQNAVESGAGEVAVSFDETPARLSIVVRDSGRGMTKEQLGRAVDPFYTDGVKHAVRKVGLGLPFMIQTVEATGGEWGIDSEPGKGTEVRFSFDLTNVDSPPVGDRVSFFAHAMLFEGGYELVLQRKRSGGGGAELEWEARRSELVEALGGFDDALSVALLRDFFESQEGEG